MPKRILASPHTVEEVGRRSVDEGPREAGIGRGGGERTSNSVASLAAYCRRSRTPQRGRGAPRSGDRPAEAENGLRTPSLASPHTVEEVGRRSVDEGPREAGIGPRRRRTDFELRR